MLFIMDAPPPPPSHRQQSAGCIRFGCGRQHRTTSVWHRRTLEREHKPICWRSARSSSADRSARTQSMALLSYAFSVVFVDGAHAVGLGVFLLFGLRICPRVTAVRTVPAAHTIRPYHAHSLVHNSISALHQPHRHSGRTPFVWLLPANMVRAMCPGEHILCRRNGVTAVYTVLSVAVVMAM